MAAQHAQAEIARARKKPSAMRPSIDRRGVVNGEGLARGSGWSATSRTVTIARDEFKATPKFAADREFWEPAWLVASHDEKGATPPCPTVYPDVVGRAGLSQPAAHGMQNIMLRRRAGTDAPYLHHRQHRDAPPARRGEFIVDAWGSVDNMPRSVETEPMNLNSKLCL